MQAERQQFDGVLSEIFAGLDKPLAEAKRDALWRGCAKMSLLELCRVRDLLLDEAANGEVPRTLGVSDLWAAKKRLRAPPAPPEPAETWAGDEWDAAAGRHLLAHIVRQSRRGIHYCSDSDRHAMSRAKGWQADATTKTLTAPLVAYKNAWARDMREWEGKPTVDQQRAAWDDCMARAETVCDQQRGQQ